MTYYSSYSSPMQYPQVDGRVLHHSISPYMMTDPTFWSAYNGGIPTDMSMAYLMYGHDGGKTKLSSGMARAAGQGVISAFFNFFTSILLDQIRPMLPF